MTAHAFSAKISLGLIFGGRGLKTKRGYCCLYVLLYDKIFMVALH
jgi:hypothetical protein